MAKKGKYPCETSSNYFTNTFEDKFRKLFTLFIFTQINIIIKFCLNNNLLEKSQLLYTSEDLKWDAL